MSTRNNKLQQANCPAPHNIKMCVNGTLDNYVCFIELLFTDQGHAIPVRGPGSLPLPPIWGKKKRTRKEEKLAEQAKQNHPSPLAQGLKLPLNTLTNTIFYGSNSSSMIKQLLKLNWLSQNVVFVSILHIIMETIIMYTHLRT